MRRDVTPVLVWAAMLGLLVAVQPIFGTNVYDYGLLGGAAVAALLLAALATMYARRPRRVPELSYGTMAVAFGGVLALMGIAFGAWLWAPGAGLAVVGLSILVLEDARW